MHSPALALVIALLVGGAPPPAGSGASVGGAVALTPVSSPDSTDLLRAARDEQRRFESIRVRLSPQTNWSGIGRCDEFVGRFCIRLPTERPDEEPRLWSPPAEHPTVKAAREDLLAVLERVGREIPGDPWVSGQHVTYLAEVGRWDEALAVARRCAASGWWCDGLEGYVLQGMGRVAEAERAFDRVLAELPESGRREWLDPRPLVDVDLWRAMGRVDGEDADRLRERVWTLANPLFLLDGNALRTEHLARRVLAETRVDARNPQAVRWGDDLTELLVRFGPEVTYERLREPLSPMGPPPVAAYYDRRGRRLTPSADAVAAPVTSGVDDWRTDRRAGRSRHLLPAVPRIFAMDVQLARFQRDGEALLAAAWALESPPRATAEDSLRVDRGDLDPEALPPSYPPGALESGFFLLDGETLSPVRHETSTLTDTTGIAVARAPAGGYLVSLEALDRGAQGWRHRRGVELGVRAPEVVALSDLLLLAPEPDPDPALFPDDAPALESEAVEVEALEALLPRAHPSTRLPLGPVEVVWEIYGLSPEAGPLDFHLTAAPSDRGFLRRAGERLGLVSTPAAVALEWEEGVREDARPREPYLRRVVLDLSRLDPGSYHLTLTLEVPGRTPLSTVRDIELVR